MGYMKKILGLLIVIGSLFIVGKVSAHEGSVDLTSGSVSCKGVSIYQDGNYRVSGRCDGPVIPTKLLTTSTFCGAKPQPVVKW